MKKYLVLVIALCAGFGAVQGQTVTVMAEQLAELQVLRQTIGQGYRIMSSGLDTIGAIVGQEFGLHQTYFASLASVKPALEEDPELAELQQLQASLVQRINAALDFWRRQQSLIINKN